MSSAKTPEPSVATASTENPADTMSKRDVVRALAGMLLAMMTAFLSSTIVSTALPTIITALNGSQNQYTWIVTATLLASTASTPIWGKLADLFSKKLLVQLSITIFTIGSIAAGFSESVETLIAWRALQGLGLGGLQSLIVIVIGVIVSPRERGKYMGPIAAVMSVATIAGPLLGGVIVDSPLGWRWCFFAGAPLAIIALLVVQRTLNVPVIKRKVSIDYLGAGLLTGGVCSLLIWVTLAGDQFAWASGTSFLLVGMGVAMLALLVFVETKVAEPIIPLRLFRDRTTVLATLAGIAVGTAMFGGAVFLGQYFQIARSYSPTAAGLLMLPMIISSTIASSASGWLITRFGRWKRFLLTGGIFMTAGFALLGTIRHDTNMVLIGVFLFILGTGTGMLMQNLVLPVQNAVAPSDLGIASSMLAFFRSLGGTVGVSVLGAILATRVADLIFDGLSSLGIDPSAAPDGEVGIGALDDLPKPLADLVRMAYGDGTATIFLVAAAVSALSILCLVAIKEVALKTKSGIQEQLEEERERQKTESVTTG
ncbi:MAG TPA: MFS transporter [Candidatus Stackebrandtia excrementipullorum]|nr:MFS transporter [Candidatus Stackebrandtia excrementipullorum]